MVHVALVKALRHSKDKDWAVNVKLRELEEQFSSIIQNSKGDDANFFELYIGVWFAEKWPHENLDEYEKENMKGFFVNVARRAARRKDVKKRRVGAAIKIASTLFMGYFDIITDFLVSKSYYEADKMVMAYSTAGK